MKLKDRLAKKYSIALLAKPEDEVVEWKAPLYRGINVGIEGFQPDSTKFSGPKYYGKGIYFHATSDFASQWIGMKPGIIVKYKPTRTLKLLKYDTPQDRIDHLKNLPKEVDGVWLAAAHQEGSPQIILRDAREVKPSGYLPYHYVETNWEHRDQLDPKKMKRIKP